MNRRISTLFAVAMTLLSQSFAHGQRETERFIPIGQSPGVSGKATRIGTVASVDTRARAFVLETPQGRITIPVGDTTRVWLDRTLLRQSALTGGFADVQPGRRVEVHFDDPRDAAHVYWIKIEVPAGNGSKRTP